VGLAAVERKKLGSSFDGVRMKYDYLVLGSGLAGLSFAALMSRAGKKVCVLEAHEFPGGYGHTFTMAKKYTFNAQLHYVWDCGKSQPVGRFLKALGLQEHIAFDKFEPLGYEKMRAPGLELDIPYDYEILIERLQRLFPHRKANLSRFIKHIERTGMAMENYGGACRRAHIVPKAHNFLRLIGSSRATLQNVFEYFDIPKEAQTLMGLQWPCFMLPPKKVSYLAWVGLVHGYHGGAYSVSRSFQYFVDSLVDTLRDGGGKIIYNRKVIDFIFDSEKCIGAISQDTNSHEGWAEHLGGKVICNFDPRRAAEMIGLEKFSRSVRTRLNYEYSPSNFIGYCAVQGIDLSHYGFGQSVFYHTSDSDLNHTYEQMYTTGNYERPSFAISTPSLHASRHHSCQEGIQLLELVTVADYQRFHDLKRVNRRAYRAKKKEILDTMLEIVSSKYVPNLKEHVCYSVGGSPTTNERYCFSPKGNSYGSNLTPSYFGINRLDERTSIDGLYFCNASAGYPGFAGTICTGMRLYEMLNK